MLGIVHTFCDVFMLPLCIFRKANSINNFNYHYVFKSFTLELFASEQFLMSGLISDSSHFSVTESSYFVVVLCVSESLRMSEGRVSAD